MIGIYKITSPSGRIYIGQSVNINKRFIAYKNLKCKSQRKLYNSFKKYGYENHVFEIIEECEKSELNIKERYYQDLYDVINKGLNCVLQELNGKSGKLSEETKLKIKTALLNRTEETKLKLSIAAKNRIMSSETRLKISNSNKGRKVSDYQIEQIRKRQQKVVYDKENDIYYESAKEASLILNIKYGKLCKMLNGILKNKTNLEYAK